MGVKEMTLDTLKNADRVIGIKQVTKAVNKGLAAGGFAADDADGRVTEPLKELCSQKGVELVNVPTMEEIGKACSIEVGAAAAALLK